MPGEVLRKNGSLMFKLPSGRVLDNRLPGWYMLPESAKKSSHTEWHSVFGDSNGFHITCWGGREDTAIHFTPKEVTTGTSHLVPGSLDTITIQKNPPALVLADGTRIIPRAETLLEKAGRFLRIAHLEAQTTATIAKRRLRLF